MEVVAHRTLHVGLTPKLSNHHGQPLSVVFPSFFIKKTPSFPNPARFDTQQFRARENFGRCSRPARAVLSGIEELSVISSQFDDFSILSRTSCEGGKELKVSVEVSGTRTRAIFDDVFDKMVAAAQPIPGFRRVKGGKTPNIPRDILLEVLGPSKVYKQVIKKVINSAVAEYVEKDALQVGKSLRIEQSFEDLEEGFEPGKKFNFDAVIQLLTDS